MPLSPGTRLGSYEIVAPLGAGGMGEVYRARDTKLGREVALKILPEVFASDPDRLMRFEREARTLASLNHPHIAGIHGVEESDGDARAGDGAGCGRGPQRADRPRADAAQRGAAHRPADRRGPRVLADLGRGFVATGIRWYLFGAQAAIVYEVAG